MLQSTLHERAPSGTFVLRLLVSDPDVNDTLTYRMVPSRSRHSDFFRLGPLDGILRWTPRRSATGRLAFNLDSGDSDDRQLHIIVSNCNRARQM